MPRPEGMPQLFANFSPENQQKYQAELAAAEKKIVKDNSDYRSYHLKGYALTQLGRYEEALEAYEQAIKIHPTELYVYNNKGVVLNSLGRYEEALEAFEQEIMQRPWLNDAYNNKGYALLRLGRYEEALQACEQTIKLDGNRGIVRSFMYVNKGIILRSLGRYDEALEAFEEADKQDSSDNSTYKVNIGELHFRQRFYRPRTRSKIDWEKVKERWSQSQDIPEQDSTEKKSGVDTTPSEVQQVTINERPNRSRLDRNHKRVKILPLPEVTEEVTGIEITLPEAKAIAQGVAAEEALDTIPLVQGTTREEFKAMVARMVEEYLLSYQPPSSRRGRYDSKRVGKRIQILAQGNKQVETIFERFVRHSKDPERLLDAAIVLTALIPGAQKFAAIGEVLNIMFGPDNEL